MALVDASLNRRIMQGICPVHVTLAGTVKAGDPLMYSTGWKLSDNTSGAPAVLVAGNSGISGQVITAFPMAVVELTHTASNVPTMGQQTAVIDTGFYGAPASTKQDAGYIVEIDTDSLHSRLVVFPMQVELDAKGT
jgi:hypothetical protein